MTRSKGARYERELVGEFADCGWFAMRTSASGSATERELPDVIVAKDGNVLVVELKYSQSKHIYVSPEKVAGLLWLAKMLNGRAYLVARWKYDATYYGYPPEMCYRTESGSYRLSKSTRESAVVLPPGVY